VWFLHIRLQLVVTRGANDVKFNVNEQFASDVQIPSADEPMDIPTDHFFKMTTGVTNQAMSVLSTETLPAGDAAVTSYS